ncbi:MAG: glycosyl hydrolase [bacterium]
MNSDANPKAQLDMERFKNPPKSDRDVNLFFMNDVLEEERLRESVRSFKEVGWGCFITRSFNGLATDYLSDAYMDALEVINDEAKKQGLGVWFQAGHMPGGMPDLPPDLAYRALCKFADDEELPEDAEVLATDDNGARYGLKSLFNNLALLEPEAIRHYLKEAYEETWFKRFGDDFGKLISGVWVDEPMLRPGTLPWCSQMEEAFEKQWGYPIRDKILDLFLESDTSARVRHHFWRTAGELLLKSYYTIVREWCDKHGVDFTGHLMGEDTLPRQISFTVACMPQYQYLSVPGIDHLTADLKWGTEDDPEGNPHWFMLTPKQCSSAAHQIGKERILSEMYGVSSQGLDFFERKYIAEFLAVMGITMRCIHGSAYSLRGKRKRIYPPTISHHQPWWAENRMITDYFARLQAVLRQGKFVADALVLHPVESAFCFYDGSFSGKRGSKIDSKDMYEMDQDLACLMENMQRAHVGFDLGDESMMAEMCKVADGALQIGEMLYPAIVLPSVHTLRATTVKLLEGFLDAGGKVFATGRLPERMDGDKSERLERLVKRLQRCGNNAAELAEAITPLLGRSYQIKPGQGDAQSVWIHERAIGEDVLLYMLNIDPDAPVSIHLAVDAGHEVVAMHPESGEESLLAVTGEAVAGLDLAFEAGGSKLLRIRSTHATAKGLAVPSSREIAVLTPPWTIKRHAPNVQTLDFCKLRCGDGEWTDPVPVIALAQILMEDAPYEGPISLEYAFDIEAIPDKLSLALEQRDAWTILLNGKPVEKPADGYYIDRAFEMVDIREYVQEGHNVLHMSREYKPPEIPKFGLQARFQNLGGVELEDVYLVGDFGLTTKPTGRTGRKGGVVYAPEFALTREKESTTGDLLADGYPFYAGSISLEQSIELPAVEKGKRLKLVFQAPEACVIRAMVNDSDAGAVAWAPWEIDITDQAISGENQIRLVLTNTLRNLLGPLHRTWGKPGHCWGPGAFSGRWDQDTNEGFPGWYKNREKDTAAWSDNYYFLPFGLGKVIVRSEEV